MNKVNRTAVAVFGVVVLLALVVGLSILGGGRGYGGWGMMGPGMMGGYGGWGFSPLGWLGMAFMWLIPISLIALTVFGVVWLVRAVGSGEGNSPRQARTCPSCGRGVQAGWVNCPICGASLAEA